MSNQYKISVIIPVYNAEKYIEKCLTSLFENTIATECEFIIINDCSSDFSEKEIKKLLREFSYLKNNIIFHSHNRNRGSAAARSTALLYCKGEYIICVDSDDWVESDYLESLYINASKTQADIVGCSLYKEFNHKTVIAENHLDANPEECIRGLLDGHIAGWLPGKLIRRLIITENSIDFIEGLDLWEDVLFSLKLFYYAKKIVYLNKPLYHYRFTPGSLVNSAYSEKRINNLMAIVSNIQDFLEKHDIYKRFKSEFDKLKIRVKVSVICGSNNNLRKKYLPIYSEIDNQLLCDKNIHYAKRFAMRMYLHNYQMMGNFIMALIRVMRLFKYR